MTFKTTGDTYVPHGSDVATRVQQLEDRWQQLNLLPTNSEMFRRLDNFRQAVNEPSDTEIEELVRSTEESNVQQPLCRPRQPMVELWHAIQLLAQVENNTAGITRVRTT